MGVKVCGVGSGDAAVLSERRPLDLYNGGDRKEIGRETQ